MKSNYYLNLAVFLFVFIMLMTAVDKIAEAQQTNAPEGFHDIGTVVFFRIPDINSTNPNHTDIGIIQGYQEYNGQTYYRVLTNPTDPAISIPTIPPLDAPDREPIVEVPVTRYFLVLPGDIFHGQ